MAGPDKLSIIVFSGDFDRVHYALATASAAAATNRAVTLLFTMGAVRALLAVNADGVPGWVALGAGESGADAAARDAAHAEKGIATFEELLGACVELGVGFRVCEIGLRAEDIDAGALRADVPLVTGGLASFLADASRDGAVLFI